MDAPASYLDTKSWNCLHVTVDHFRGSCVSVVIWKPFIVMESRNTFVSMYFRKLEGKIACKIISGMRDLSAPRLVMSHELLHPCEFAKKRYFRVLVACSTF